MIENIDSFVEKYKLLLESEIDVYREEGDDSLDWSTFDFNVEALKSQIASEDRKIVIGILKRAYDFIKVHHRAYVIYRQSRSDYYDYARYDKERDKLLTDRIVSKLKVMLDQAEAYSG